MTFQNLKVVQQKYFGINRHEINWKCFIFIREKLLRLAENYKYKKKKTNKIIIWIKILFWPISVIYLILFYANGILHEFTEISKLIYLSIQMFH